MYRLSTSRLSKVRTIIFISVLFLVVPLVTVSFAENASLDSARNNNEILKTVFDYNIPSVAIKGIPFSVSIKSTDMFIDPSRIKVLLNGEKITIDNRIVRDESDPGKFEINELILEAYGKNIIEVFYGDERILHDDILVISGLLTLLPPLFAIIFALLFRQVIIALTTGIWLGASIISGYDPLGGLFRTIDHYIRKSVSDPDRVAILLFTIMLGGMIGVISRAGGTLGVVNKLKRIAKSPRRAQIATWLMGLFIFFDDYSNTLIVGNTMRPITDRLKVSREKLSYIVDSTAAPVTSIAIVTTWVGFQISLIAGAFNTLGIEDSPFVTFVESVPFQFYSIFAIVFVFLIAFSGRDYGPMLKAERRARDEGKVIADNAMPIADFSPDMVNPPKGAPLRWYNAIIPIVFVIVGALSGLIISGYTKLKAAGDDVWKDGFLSGLKDIFSSAESFQVLLIVSFLGCIIALTLAIIQRILSLSQSMEALVSGFKSMLMAVIILVLAGAIGDICADLKTADYIATVLKGGMSIIWLPTITFIVASFISFSTGTSWGTMSILTPLVIPLTYKIAESAAIGEAAVHKVMLISIASIMGGAVFGDHSSPISDTTIMSSIASSSDHIHHVKTQFPYAVIVAAVAMIAGILPASIWGFPAILGILIGTTLLLLFVRFIGQKDESIR